MITEAQKTELAASRALGLSYRAIEDKTGISRSSVSKYLNDSEVKALIEESRSRLISQSLDKAVSNIAGLVEEYQSPITDQDDKLQTIRKEHGYKATVRLLETAGILNSNSPAAYIQNIFNANTTYVSPIVDDLLSKQIQDSAIEVIPESIEE